MKILIYLALIIGFLMFYQTNPAMAMLFVVIGGGLFLYFKVRKKKGSSGARGTFFSGKGSEEGNNADDLITLFMLQNLMNTNSRPLSNNSRPVAKRELKKESEIEKTKREVLELLDD